MDNPNPYHHRLSLRIKGYDYSKSGMYFVTICAHDMQHLFGEISDDGLILNKAGEHAAQCWKEIPGHFPLVILHDFIIMPNHIHGIIEIIPDKIGVGAENIQPLRSPGDNIQPLRSPGDNIQPLRSPGDNIQPLRHNINEFQNVISGSIGSIIRGFKIGVTKWFRTNSDIKNVWQRNYYEHIIRSKKAYRIISNYIIQNPEKWKTDKYFSQNNMRI
jgi:REP element-mobilizing transposase RayT